MSKRAIPLSKAIEKIGKIIGEQCHISSRNHGYLEYFIHPSEVLSLLFGEDEKAINEKIMGIARDELIRLRHEDNNKTIEDLNKTRNKRFIGSFPRNL